MATQALLSDVVGEIDICPQEATAYVHRITGECFILMMDDEMLSLERDADGEGDQGGGERKRQLPEWQQEMLVKKREISDSPDWIELPTKRDFHEYRVMEDFCESLSDQQAGKQILGAMRGRGVFRRFRVAVERAGVVDEWYQYRNERFTQFVMEWLDEKGIPYAKDSKGKS